MNKRLHRIVFNAARGQRMVVQETAKASSKDSAATPVVVALTLASALFVPAAFAQISGDPNAPGNQRPTVLVAPNGVPVVNIQAPSAAGVSRNTYKQFDVNANGAILNNSRTNVQTQQGGWVQGNPWLATGPARIILNEVNSTNPSQLRGYVEVAGQRAEVIIANPAGIQVDGGGFINARRATLTTGTPQFGSQGSLESFLVRGGTISIEGSGLDASKTDYAAILARAVQVNAGIWASDLKVVAGANQVSADASQVAPAQGAGATPTFALDVAQLGGMYANKIVLIGTEAGVGVRNAGSIGAGAGGLVVTAAGRLENIGTLEAPRVELASGADTVNSGTIRQAGSAALDISAASLSNTNGGVIGAEPVAAAPSQAQTPVTPSAPGGSGQANSSTSSVGGSIAVAEGGDQTVPAYVPPAPGSITAAGALHNDGGRIFAGGPVSLTAPQIDNSGGNLTVSELAVTGPRFGNAGGTLTVNKQFSANVGQFDNQGGTLHAAALQIDTTGDLNNQGGTLVSDGDANVAVGGDIHNAGTGAIRAERDVAINTAGVLASDGSITAGRNTNVNARSVQASASSVLGAGVAADGTLAQTGDLRVVASQELAAKGTNLAAGQLAFQGARVDLSGGKSSAANLSLTSTQGDITTSNATLTTQGTFTATANANGAQSLVNEAGTINAGQLDLHVANIRNTQGGSIEQVGTGATDIHVTGNIDNAGGTIASNGVTTLSAYSLHNDAGQIKTAEALTVQVDGALSNRAGTLQAARGVTVASAGLDNEDGKVIGSSLAIDTHAQALNNVQGTLAGTTGAVDILSGALQNDAGLVLSDAALSIDTHGQALSNTNAAGHQTKLNDPQGGIVSGGALSIRTQGGNVDNANGQIVASNGGDLGIDASAGDVNNASGFIHSTATTTVSASSVTNTGTQASSQGIEGRQVDITTARLDNRAGAIRADANATITSAGTVDNSGGLMSAGDTLSIVDPSRANAASKTLVVSNAGGTLVANKSLQIDAAQLVGPGNVTSQADLAIALTQDVINNTELQAGGNFSYTTLGNFTNNAKLAAGQTLTVGGNNVDNTADAEMSGADTVVNAVGTLTNRGLIDSAGDTQLNAQTLNNAGTGRIYGDRISIAANVLNNASEATGGVVRAGTIASRTSDIDIGVQTLNNSDGALITSGNNLYIGGALDDGRMAVGRAQVVNNTAATIESTGDMVLGAQQLNNINRGFSTQDVTTNEAGNALYIASQPTGERYTVDELGQCHKCGADRDDNGSDLLARLEYVMPSAQYPFEKGYARKPYQLPAAGGVYGSEDPVWALFNVPVGDTAALTPKLQAYNADFMARAWRTYTQITVTNTETTQTEIVNAGVAGRLTSGGDMALNIGAGVNDNSQVIAGGALTGNADSLVNTQVGGKRLVVDSGSWHTDFIEYSPYRPKVGYFGTGDYQQVVENKSIDLSSAVKLQNTAPGSVGANASQANLGKGGASAGATGNANRTGAIFEVVSSVGAQGAGANSTPVVRTSAPNATLPSASIFSTHPGTGHYLIETDPRFANYRAWLSSDYLLTALGQDPANVQKRLGDGYYEQRLIREQVAQLTGNRFLDGYSSDEDEYTALMNSGATFAKQFNLTPGIGLTAAQMAQLTSDIVWLVEQTVTLPDGSTEKVLVPQVYVRVKASDINGAGALLSGDSVDLKVGGDLTNRGGTIAGRNAVKIGADNINNLNGGRITGQDVSLDAKTDINNIGSTIDAANGLSVVAGRDINVKTTTTSDSRQVGASSFSETGVDRVAGLYVTGTGGMLTAKAGNDLNLQGAKVQSAGSVGLTATRDINLTTVTESKSDNFIGDAKNYAHSTQSSEVGTQITADGNLSLTAKRDINARQANVDAGDGLLTVHADRDINIQAGARTQTQDSANQGTSHGFLSKTTTTVHDSSAQSLSQGSTFNGGTTAITAGNNITIEDAHISGKEDVLITADNKLDIHEGRDVRSESHETSVSKKGLGISGGSLPMVVAVSKGASDLNSTYSNTASAGTIQSSEGGVLLQGDTAVALQGVQVDAAKNLTVKGGEVSIRAATNTHETSAEHTTKDLNLGTGTWWREASTGINAKRTDTADHQSTDLTRTTLNGANVSLTASSTLTIAGTTVNTPGKLELNAEKLVLATQATDDVTRNTGAGRDVMYQKNSDQGQHDQTTHYDQFNAGALVINANKVQADLSVKDSIAQLTQQPGMGWMNQLQSDPKIADKVDWKAVQEAHDNWDYKQQGLTKEGAVIVTLVSAYFAAGAAAGAGSAASEVVTAQGVAAMGEGGFVAAGGLTVSSAVGGAVAAGVTAVASEAAVSLINNQGDVGKTLKDLGSKDSIKSLLTAMATGGVLAGLNLNPTGLPTEGAGAQQFFNQLSQNLQAGAARAVIDHAINGTSLEDGLKTGLVSALIDTAAAQSAFAIGEANLDDFTNKIAHALAGCAAGAAKADNSSGCAAGAIGAVIGEISAEHMGFDENGNPNPEAIQMAAVLGGIGGALAGLDADQINLAASAAANSAANNGLKHYVDKALGKLADGLKALELKPLQDAKKLISDYLESAAARGGLSDVEIMSLGVMYAANEALFPTSLLDLTPGGKALGNAGKLIKAGATAEDAVKLAKLEVKAAGNAGELAARAANFEKDISRLPPGERVAAVKQQARDIAMQNEWTKDNRLSRLNNRDVYQTPDGGIFSVDTQHGRFEKINPKTGAHEGEVRLLDQNPITNSVDNSGGHDLRMK